MTDEAKIKAFIEASDNANDYSEAQAAALEQAALEDLDDLYNNEDNRDAELWQAVGVSPQLVVADYEDDDTRDLEWSLGLAGIGAAALTQFVLDNREDLIIKPVAYREQVLSGLVLTKAELIAAGKRMVETVTPTRYMELQAKYLTDLSFLADVSDKELYSMLTELKALQPVDKMIAANMDYVARMTAYPKGSPQFKSALSDLISRDSKRGLRQMNRRAVQRVYTAREIGGDMQRLLVWISEGAHPCDACADRAGEVATYEEWESRGLPGAETCYGGDYCKCHLAAA